MPSTAREFLQARTSLIDDLMDLFDIADGGERGPSDLPLCIWQDLMLALDELRALPVSRTKLEAIKSDVAALEQAVRAWSACGYQPCYGLGRRLLLQARAGLRELIPAIAPGVLVPCDLAA